MTQTWRKMVSRDIPFVYAIAIHIHKELHEDIDVFIERLALCPEGCFVLEETETESDTKTVVCGYLISHPYRLGESPPLNTLIRMLPVADCWYIHDLAILEPYRLQGYASKGLSLLEEHLNGLTTMSLTSVSGSEPFWKKHGFVSDPSVHCSSYGLSVYMIKPIG